MKVLWYTHKYLLITFLYNCDQQGSSPFGSGENLYKHLSDSSRPDDGANLSVGKFIVIISVVFPKFFNFNAYQNLKSPFSS